MIYNILFRFKFPFRKCKTSNVTCHMSHSTFCLLPLGGGAYWKLICLNVKLLPSTKWLFPQCRVCWRMLELIAFRHDVFRCHLR